MVLKIEYTKTAIIEKEENSEAPMTRSQRKKLLVELDDGDITFREFFENYEAMLMQEVEERVALGIFVARRADAKKTKVLFAVLVAVTAVAILMSPPVYREVFGHRNAEECALHAKNDYAIDVCYDLYPSVTARPVDATSNSSPPPPGPQIADVAPAPPAERSMNTPPRAANPEHGSIYWYSEPQEVVAPFEINSERGANYFVKFYNELTGADVLGVFVVGGRPVSTLVPTGRYLVKYATGETWHGYEDYFGKDAVYSKANTVFEFSLNEGGTTGYSLTLHTVKNGNLRTSEIKREEF